MTVVSTNVVRTVVANREGPWHRTVEGLHVAKLTGSDFEMGRQHGAMLREAVLDGPMPYYKAYVEKMVRKTALGGISPLLVQGVTKLLGGRVARAFPERVSEGMRGLAEGAGLPYREVLEGATMPDSLVWLASKLMKVRRIGPAMHHRVAIGLGCTSAIAWGDATVDGKLLHARNMDYHGVDCWPKTASVIFYEPDDGLRYVSVVAAGVHLGGVTSMNEAGLSLTVHQHMFSNSAQLGGTPIGWLGDEVMRRATNLDEAEAILGRYRPIGCWTYLVTDGKTKQVLCWEENPKRHAAIRTRPDDTTFGYTNIYLDPELGATETALYGSYWRANQGRYQRANDMLRAGHGSLDPDAMTAILGDDGTTDCRIKDSIAMLMTVGSVVFRPEDGAFWVATGKAPTSQNPFVGFSLAAEDHVPELGTLTGGVPSDETSVRAFEAYRDSYLAFFDEEDLGEARRLAETACSLQPKQALYHMLVGLLSLADGEATAAFDAFTRALDLGHPDDERIASFHLWRGRAADLSGKRGKAIEDYRRALGHAADEPLHKAARRGLKKRFTARHAQRMAIDYTFIDVLSP